MNSRPDRTACQTCTHDQWMPSRRSFLATTGIALSTVALGDLFPGRVLAQDEASEVTLANYPRQPVGRVSALEPDVPVVIAYPEQVAHNAAMLVRLGVPAGGGVGEGQDIVAFSTRCTHMGGDLANEYHAQYKVAGPCREHLTTFDLTRHGMVVSGHATQSLPQLVLQIEGDEIYATGIIGLLFGHHAAPTSPTTEV